MKYKTASFSTLEQHNPALAAALTAWRESGVADAKHLHRAGAVARILDGLPESVAISGGSLRAVATNLG